MAGAASFTPTADPYSASQISSGNQGISSALSAVNSAQANQQTPDQIMNQENTALGVPQAQQQVSGLQQAITNTTNLLNQVAPTVEGNTANSLVTASQQGQQIANQSAPIQADLSSDTSAYNTANANYTNLEGQAENLANADLTQQNDQITNLENMEQEAQNQLDSMLSANSNTDQLNAQEQEYQAELSANSGGNITIGGNSGSTTPTSTSNGKTSSTSNTGAQMVAKGGNATNGYAFTNNGQSVNAAQYASDKGISLYTLLNTMAASGDVGAKTALTFTGSNGQADPTKMNSANLALANELGIPVAGQSGVEGVLSRLFGTTPASNTINKENSASNPPAKTILPTTSTSGLIPGLTKGII